MTPNAIIIFSLIAVSAAAPGYQCRCDDRTGDDLIQCHGYNNVTGTVRYQSKEMLEESKKKGMMMNGVVCNDQCSPLILGDQKRLYCNGNNFCAFYNQDSYGRPCLSVGKTHHETWAECTSAGEGSPWTWTHPPMCVFKANSVAFKFQ